MVKSLRLALAMAMMCFAVVANAQTKSYTENLVVTINDQSTEPQPATINVETLENGNINFTLKNFILGSGDEQMAVGNIALTDLALTDAGYCKTFSFIGNITIAAGDQEGVELWMGPYLGEIPLTLNGKMTDDKLYVTIDIDLMESLSQIIHVTLGEDIKESTEPEGPAVVSSKSYTEDLVVTINDQSTEPQPATINVETLDNGNINFTLKNFILGSGDEQMAVGNIALTDLALTDAGYCKTFSYNGNILIEAGDQEGVDLWYGPYLGEIPLALNGKMTDNKLYVTIDIDLQESLNQIIHVALGEDIIDPSTEISTLNGNSKNEETYTLSGLRVKNVLKGNVYIVNGKKVIY